MDQATGLPGFSDISVNILSRYVSLFGYVAKNVEQPKPYIHQTQSRARLGLFAFQTLKALVEHAVP